MLGALQSECHSREAKAGLCLSRCAAHLPYQPAHPASAGIRRNSPTGTPTLAAGATDCLKGRGATAGPMGALLTGAGR